MGLASRRASQISGYLFDRLEAKKDEAIASGVDVIDLGVGDPDLPSPPEVVEALCRSAKLACNHRYPPYRGTSELRRLCARWLRRRYGIEVDMQEEILVLIGSKEGLVHLALAVVDPGDVVLCPDPGYPVYRAAAILAGGQPVALPLLAENGFLADLSLVPSEILKKAKLVFVNYPNNPTSASATVEFFEQIAALAKKEDIVVCNDAAYIQTVLEGPPHPSLLAQANDFTNLIEFFSFSKAFNMTGWRVAFAAGDRRLVDALASVKMNIDSGVFLPIQAAAAEAVSHCEEFTPMINEVYRQRRDILVEGLQRAGIEAVPPRATFYVWARVPGGLGSEEFAELLLERCGILATPGISFGEYGEGYIRFALTVSTERIAQAAKKLETLPR